MPTPREVAEQLANLLSDWQDGSAHILCSGHPQGKQNCRQWLVIRERIEAALIAREAAVWEQAKKLAQSTRGNGEVEAWNLGYAAACAYIEDQCEQRSRSGRGNPMTEAR